ncbi:UNVERIFIED_CONTAM: hypothetical protein FKN15_074827 [Acipenser sinensis]
MVRKSCKKQQKRQQPQQQQLNKRWWSRVPSKFGPPDWAAEQEQWRKEGAPMCDACGEFGHVREDCPYGDPQYEEAWNQGLVGDAAEWFWAVDQTRPSPAHQREEPERPAPEREEPERPQPQRREPERPQPKRGESVRPQPKRGKSEHPQPKPGPAEEKCLLAPPPSPEEISWEAILHTVEVSCWCPSMESGGIPHSTAPSHQKNASCLYPHRSHQQRESACWSHHHQQREHACWFRLHHHQQREHACWFRLHHHQQREHACWFRLHHHQQREHACWFRLHHHQQREHAWFRLHRHHQQREHACWFHGCS